MALPGSPNLNSEFPMNSVTLMDPIIQFSLFVDAGYRLPHIFNKKYFNTFKLRTMKSILECQRTLISI